MKQIPSCGQGERKMRSEAKSSVEAANRSGINTLAGMKLGKEILGAHLLAASSVSWNDQRPSIGGARNKMNEP